VDAGDCLGANVTGLGTGSGANGSSSGLNKLTGYGFGGAGPWAIRNLNGSGPAVLAYNNNFGAGVSDDIRLALEQVSPVEFTQSGGLLVACPAPVTVQCVTDVPAGAADLAQFFAVGGVASCSPGTVVCADASGPGGTIVRTYTINDNCGNSVTCTQLITVVWPESANTNLSISEFLAKNIIGITDEDGDHSDWLEIRNAGPCPVNLNGWAITDNALQLTKWRFPATNIAPGQYLVVWLSDKNRRIPGAPLHANFKLSDEGEYLGLVRPDGVTIASQFSPKFPPQQPDVSYGLPSDSPTNNYLAWPTPGLPNSPGTNFIVASLRFNPPRGWFTNFVSVSIRTPTPGVTIYYTTDGSAPSPTNGFVYTQRLGFTNTTVLRAAAYRPGFVPAIQTHTYIFPDRVLYQTGAGFPTSWKGYTLSNYTTVPAYYAMSSNMVNDPRWSNLIHEALLSVPTVSVGMNLDDLFGFTRGIYSNPMQEGEAWERPCSVEYFSPDGRPQFQINCGIRMQGSLSTEPDFTPKHNFRLLFKQMYGSGRLTHELYPESAVHEFDTLVLHASFNDHWVWPLGNQAQFHRDQWCADTQAETGGHGTHGQFVQLFVNGLYWGMYNLGERPDDSYAAHYLGGEKSDYDAVNAGELTDGDWGTWNEMLAIARAGITNDSAYQLLGHYLNIPHFIDYMLINFYAANQDWPNNNYRAAGSVSNGVPWHFFSWDAELTLGRGLASRIYVTNNVTDLGPEDGAPGLLYSALREFSGFRREFGDHAQKMLYNNGALTPDVCVARWMRRAHEIEDAIVAEAARWGDINWGGFFTRDDWLAEQSYLLMNWFPYRTDVLVAQLREADLLPRLDAPQFTPHGGIISEPLSVQIQTPAGSLLYYTTNGSDPRLPDGTVSPDAQAYEGSSPLTLILTTTTHLLARAFATNTWSALTAAAYPLREQVDLRITAITYRDDGAVKLDLVAFPGIRYTLQACSSLRPSPPLPSEGEPGGWLPLASIVPFADGTYSFLDITATNHSVRFYRIAWP
jgi:hypothetical protein